jgi:hypothetical protein
MRPVVSDLESELLILKLVDFESSLMTWINQQVISSFFGEPLTIDTGFRIQKFMENSLQDMISEYPVITGYSVADPTSKIASLIIKITFFMNSGSFDRSIRVNTKGTQYDDI